MALVEYNFFRGGFGFNPKTFTNLIPNVIKQNIPNPIVIPISLPDKKIGVDITLPQVLYINYSASSAAAAAAS